MSCQKMVFSCRGKTCAAKSANIKALYFSSVTKRLSANGQMFNCAFNSLCFDFNFALRGFTNHAFVFELLSCRALFAITKTSQKKYCL